MQPELVRGYVQRVRVARLGDRAVALFEVRIPGETVHLVCAAGAGVGVLDESGRAALRVAMRASHALADRDDRDHLAHAANVASATNALWRARFEGASVTRTTLRAVDFAREGKIVRADCDGGRDGRDGGLRILDDVIENTPEGGEPTRRELEDHGAAIAAALSTLGRVGRRDALARALRKAIAKVERRVAAVTGDLSRIGDADALAARAQLFVAVASNAPRGTRQLRAVDWSSGQATVVELTIDPARSAGEQMNALFKRARRLKEGGRIARARLEEARAALAGLEGALTELANDQADLDALEARGRAAAARDFKLAPSGARGSSMSGPRERERAARPPYRTFVGASQARILVGRGAAHNDTLTLQVARPHDLWLHARGTAGAHVVVPLPKGKSCPPDWLVEAAHLAAHFSDARDERLVDVVYTPRRYLRKPRGSAPGLVVVDREKVFVLRKDDQILKRLLEAEVV
jgi:hypothetical protein